MLFLAKEKDYPGSLFWSLWAGSNRRPADYESAALPTEPHKHK